MAYRETIHIGTSVLLGAALVIAAAACGDRISLAGALASMQSEVAAAGADALSALERGRRTAIRDAAGELRSVDHQIRALEVAALVTTRPGGQAALVTVRQGRLDTSAALIALRDAPAADVSARGADVAASLAALRSHTREATRALVDHSRVTTR